MKKNFLKEQPHDLVDFFDNYAPLLLKDKAGRFMSFPDWTKMYLHLLRKLREEFPRGFIEVAYYLGVHYEMRNVEVEPFLQQCKNRHGQEKILMVNWLAMEPVDIDQLSKFCMTLHYLTETRFRLDLFREACQIFKGVKKYEPKTE